jgi:hypothetical protein
LQDSIKQEERKRKQVEKSLDDDKKVLAGKEGVLGGMKDIYDALRQENDKCQAALKAAQDR